MRHDRGPVPGRSGVVAVGDSGPGVCALRGPATQAFEPSRKPGAFGPTAWGPAGRRQRLRRWAEKLQVVETDLRRARQSSQWHPRSPIETSGGDAAHSALLVVLKRLDDLVASVHDERTVPGDWLADGRSSQQEYLQSR